ncbi:hypothetical protein [Aureivirga sp. CE67]|uniref:hypothetical protein n=1 Tax=Aureivirga sp. CE67 TaxID=1788983 RepID=UPI0018C8F565|nr:hypothetical protein [Aureivirga sp. CE67]
MRGIIIYTKKSFDKKEVLIEIEKFAIKDNYQIKNIETRLDLSIRIIKDFVEINFHFFKEKKHLFNINNEEYFAYLEIEYDTKLSSHANILAKKIMEKYSEVFMSNEAYSDFYNYDDIISGNIPEWFK